MRRPALPVARGRPAPPAHRQQPRMLEAPLRRWVWWAEVEPEPAPRGRWRRGGVAQEPEREPHRVPKPRPDCARAPGLHHEPEPEREFGTQRGWGREPPAPESACRSRSGSGVPALLSRGPQLEGLGTTPAVAGTRARSCGPKTWVARRRSSRQRRPRTPRPSLARSGRPRLKVRQGLPPRPRGARCIAGVPKGRRLGSRPRRARSKSRRSIRCLRAWRGPCQGPAATYRRRLG